MRGLLDYVPLGGAQMDDTFWPRLTFMYVTYIYEKGSGYDIHEMYTKQLYVYIMCSFESLQIDKLQLSK